MKNILSFWRNFICLFLLSSIYLYGSETKPTIAVLDLKAIDISRSDAVFISNFLTQDLTKTGKFRVIDRVNIDKILIEQGFQQTGCTESECAVEIGKILNIKYAVVGNIGWLANKYTVAITIINVETGEVVFATDFGLVRRDNIRSVSRIITKKIINYLIEGKEVEKAYKTVPRMPKIKSIMNKELTVDQGKEAGMKKRQIYHILDNDFNKIGKLRIVDTYYGGATAKILKVNKIFKLRTGLPLEYSGKMKVLGIGFMSGMANSSYSSSFAFFTYFEYIHPSGHGFQINLGSVELDGYKRIYIKYSNYELPKTRCKIRRSHPIFYKKHFYYGCLISPYIGIGIAKAEDVDIEQQTMVGYLSPVLNTGISLFSDRRKHLIIDIKYFGSMENEIKMENTLTEKTESITVVSIGMSFNW